MLSQASTQGIMKTTWNFLCPFFSSPTLKRQNELRFIIQGSTDILDLQLISLINDQMPVLFGFLWKLTGILVFEDGTFSNHLSTCQKRFITYFLSTPLSQAFIQHTRLESFSIAIISFCFHLMMFETILFLRSGICCDRSDHIDVLHTCAIWIKDLLNI